MRQASKYARRTIDTTPYGSLRRREVDGRTMAYIDEGEGDAIVFQHGNPTSSYLWRNVMPHLEGLGRLIACDLIGMGGSDKLGASGPDRYHYAEQREYLFALLDALDLGDRVVLVLHDWGSALGFDWARRHAERVQGIAYMEAMVAPFEWSDFPPQGRPVFERLRSPAGEGLILDENVFVEQVLPGSVLRGLTDAEMTHYRRPFLEAGEGRRPTLSLPRDIPIDGEPAEVVEIVDAYSRWLAGSEVPKLFVNAEPGSLIAGPRIRELVRSWPNQTEVTVAGRHYVQEDSPHEIGAAVADFVRGLRLSP